MRILDHLTTLSSEALARTTTRREALTSAVKVAFSAALMLAFFGDPAYAAACDQCQSWYTGCNCNPPYARFCSGCPTTAGGIPAGKKRSYAWGYSSTGCWCTSCSTSDYKVCCDFTTGSDPNTRYSSDCGCSWSLRQSGYCVAGVPKPAQ